MRRRKHRREDYIPRGAIKFADRESSAIVYAYTAAMTGEPALMGFHGRAQKPDFNYRFPNAKARERYAQDHFKRFREWEAARKPKGRQVAPGDVLKCSWGYDQTNVDYYQVTRLIGEQYVEVRELQTSASYEGQQMAGYVVPLPGEFVGEPLRRKADGDCVKISSCQYAFKVDPVMVGGVPTYQPARYTAYA